MNMNPKKSAIMKTGKARNKCPKTKSIMEIPIVNEYKYLGGLLKNDLSIKSHISQVQRKIDFIRFRLSSIRWIKDMKLNINLFKVFCLPLYSLCFTNSIIKGKSSL